MSDDRPQNIKDDFPLRPTVDDECECGHKYSEHSDLKSVTLTHACYICVCNNFLKIE